MPCNSDHLEATQLEVECSRMYLLLGELAGGGPPDSSSSAWAGYDDRAYCKADRALADELTQELCDRIANIELEGDLTTYSLELQIWARDHKIADAKRKKREAAEKTKAAIRKAALAKLTPAERKALGI
jgi:hypothetical protein